MNCQKNISPVYFPESLSFFETRNFKQLISDRHILAKGNPKITLCTRSVYYRPIKTMNVFVCKSNELHLSYLNIFDNSPAVKKVSNVPQTRLQFY